MRLICICFLSMLSVSCAGAQKQGHRSLASYTSVPSDKVEVFKVISDAPLAGDLQSCKPIGTEACPHGWSTTVLKAGQLVWISGWMGSSAVVIYIKDFERGAAGSGTMDPSALQKVEGCTVSHLVSAGRCD